MWKAKFYRSASRGASLKADRFFRHRRALAEYGDGRRGDGEGVARHHVPADISQLVPFSACFPLSRGAALPQGRKDSSNGRSGHLRRELRPPMSPGILSFFGFCSGKCAVFPFFRKKSSVTSQNNIQKSRVTTTYGAFHCGRLQNGYKM